MPWSIPGQADLTPSFLETQAVLSTTASSEPYLLALGSLEKINSQWRAENDQLVSGQSSGTTYELKNPLTLDSAWQAMGDHFTALDASLVYACEGMACGSSNAWANQHFGVKQLYGLDLSQKYQVWQVQVDGATQLAAIYLVQRGNRRIYAHVDIIVPDDQTLSLPPSASVLAKHFYSSGMLPFDFVVIRDGGLDIDQRYMANVADALNRQPFRRLQLSATIADESQRALVDQLFAQLVSAGIRERRLSVAVDIDSTIDVPVFQVELAKR